MGVRDDRKVLHLKLPQIGRGGQAGLGAYETQQGGALPRLYLPVVTLQEDPVGFETTVY